MHDKEQVIAYVRNFRNMVQSFLFKKVVDQFMNQYERIMSNDPKADVEELLSVERAFVKDLKKVWRSWRSALKTFATRTV